MIVSIRPGRSGFAQYATDRPDAAYTIIEGDPKRIDNITNKLLAENENRKVSHYSFVLSFKEENLTKDQLYDYYEQFKTLTFKNYDPRELEILSVIHWDDNKPHIHVYVVNYSQLTGRDLRLYRGYPDFKRIEAVQEIINYNNGLESPFSNSRLFQLSQEQKKRDWLFKKGKSKYIVFDDFVEKEIKKAILGCESYKEFLQIIENVFGKIQIVKNEKISDSFSSNTLLKEYDLVLKDKKLKNNNGHYRYRSKLFDEKWFNANLNILQKKLKQAELSKLTYKHSGRKTLNEYENLHTETLKTQETHLNERKVGKSFLERELDHFLSEDLKKILDILNSPMPNISELEIMLERHLSFYEIDNIHTFLLKMPYSKYSIKKDCVEFLFGEHAINLYDVNLFSYLTGDQKFIDHDSALQEQYYLEQATLDLSLNKNKTIARSSLEKLFYLKKIKTEDEFEKLIRGFGLKVKRHGLDKNKGGYVSLGNESGIFSLYNEFVYCMYINNRTIKDYEQRKISAIESSLQGKFVNKFVETVCANLLGKGEFVSSVRDYKLHNSQIKNYEITGENKKHFIYKKNSTIHREHLKDLGDKVIVERSIDETITGFAVSDLFFMKGSSKISVDSKNKEFINAIIQRIKLQQYPISVFDGNGKTLYLHSDNMPSLVSQETSRLLNDKLKVFSSYSDTPISALLVSIYENEMQNRVQINKLKDQILQISNVDRSVLEAISKTVDIKYLKNGLDTVKGKYVTFEYKNKKFSIYDDSLYAMFEDPKLYELEKLKNLTNKAGREKIIFAEKKLRELNELLHIKKNCNLVVENPYELNEKKQTTYYRNSFNGVDHGNKIILNKIGDYKRASHDIVAIALKNKWQAILIKDEKIMEEVLSLINQNSLKLAVYDSSGVQQNIENISLNDTNEYEILS